MSSRIESAVRPSRRGRESESRGATGLNGRVTLLSTSDVAGAGNAARRLLDGLRDLNGETRMLVLRQQLRGDGVERHVERRGFAAEVVAEFRKRRRWRRQAREFAPFANTRPDGVDLFSHVEEGADLSGHAALRDADLVNVHWVNRLCDLPATLPSLRGKPVVWTLHDMNAFTGGCHYSGDCTRYEQSCGACPQLGSADERDVSSKIWKLKRATYDAVDLHIVTPSRWLADCAKASTLVGDRPIHVIPGPVPETVFTPRDQGFCRDLLGLPRDETLILFGAEYQTHRKGGHKLLEALKGLREHTSLDGVGLAVFGSPDLGAMEGLDMPVHGVGYLQDELALACVYAAADFFVIPSLEDNLPNTVLEAMACGLPVIGFDAGGIGEMISHEETGLVAGWGDAGELARHIARMIDDEHLRSSCGRRGREIIEQEHTIAVHAGRYASLFNDLLAR